MQDLDQLLDRAGAVCVTTQSHWILLHLCYNLSKLLLAGGFCDLLGEVIAEWVHHNVEERVYCRQEYPLSDLGVRFIYLLLQKPTAALILCQY